MYLKSVHAFYNIHTTQSNRIWQIAVEYVRDNQKLFSRYEEQLLPKRKEKKNYVQFRDSIFMTCNMKYVFPYENYAVIF